ncbi:hypothetical protein D3C83_197620 [compost metagenome]
MPVGNLVARNEFPALVEEKPEVPRAAIEDFLEHQIDEIVLGGAQRVVRPDAQKIRVGLHDVKVRVLRLRDSGS